MIRRLLIANRGEIALRIVRACRKLGIESVAVHSTIDARAPHVLAADRAEQIGPPAPTDSYLSIPAVLEAARRSGADAVHPGYGFLSENSQFAASCEQAGMIFVGPSANVIARMGSKIEARRTMEAAGVPVVPGEVPAEQTDQVITKAVERLGYPVLLKPSSGGGGKGMRIIRDGQGLRDVIGAARREAVAAFGNGTLYVERLIDRPRHVEVQIFADHSGRVVHLFERECSLQRRHQKIVEESPSTALTPKLRERMTTAAVTAARATGYRNAGTIEFLLEGQGDSARFYFLEMNTRLQVEHPVTEAVTGVDIVQAQLVVAAGGALPWSQESLSQSGHAIECRLYAEDPSRGFLPQAGRLLLYREPSGPGVRVDAGVVEGSDVPVFYDPLLAKLIVHGESRETAIGRAVAALRQYPVLGIRTNLSLLRRVLDHPRFRAGRIDTGFIEAELATLLDGQDDRPLRAAIAAAAMAAAAEPALSQKSEMANVSQTDDKETASAQSDPWETLRRWRM